MRQLACFVFRASVVRNFNTLGPLHGDSNLVPHLEKAPSTKPRYVRDWTLLEEDEMSRQTSEVSLQKEDQVAREQAEAMQNAGVSHSLSSLLEKSYMDVAEEAILPSDPALQVRVDKKTRQPRFTREQNEYLWEARKKDYSKVLHKFKIVLSSHMSETEKCHQLLALHDVAMRKRLRLIDSTYDAMFGVFLQGLPKLGGDGKGSTAPMVDQVWRVYRYMIDSGTNPTPKIHQHLMMLLESVRATNGEIEAKAHALMLDNDRFKLIPTEYTLQHYILICGHNNSMHIAVSRLTDARGRLQLMPSASLCSNVLRGLLRNDQIDEALQFVQTLDSVAMTDHLLNSVLQVLRRSSDPSSCFAAFRSMRGSGLPPSLATVSTLLEVCYEINDFSEIPFILKLMKQYGLKGDERFSNKLLVGLHKAELPEAAQRLEASMRKFNVRVYDEVVRGVRR